MTIFTVMDGTNEICPVSEDYKYTEASKLRFMKESIDKVLLFYV